MAKFKVGDRVRMAGGDQGTILTPVRNGGNTVTVRFDDGMVHCIREADLLPATDTKSLRAKYKAAPKEIDYDKPILKDYYTNKEIRNATRQEMLDSREAAKYDGGSGVIDVGGRSCYVEE